MGEANFYYFTCLKFTESIERRILLNTPRTNIPSSSNYPFTSYSFVLRPNIELFNHGGDGSRQWKSQGGRKKENSGRENGRRICQDCGRSEGFLRTSNSQRRQRHRLPTSREESRRQRPRARR